VPSPFRIARQLLDRLEDSKSGEVHGAFQVDIPPQRYQEMYELVTTMNEQSIK
jgi:hypothetical protein